VTIPVANPSPSGSMGVPRPRGFGSLNYLIIFIQRDCTVRFAPPPILLPPLPAFASSIRSQMMVQPRSWSEGTHPLFFLPSFGPSGPPTLFLWSVLTAPALSFVTARWYVPPGRLAGSAKLPWSFVPPQKATIQDLISSRRSAGSRASPPLPPFFHLPTIFFFSFGSSSLPLSPPASIPYLVLVSAFFYIT